MINDVIVISMIWYVYDSYIRIILKLKPFSASVLIYGRMLKEPCWSSSVFESVELSTAHEAFVEDSSSLFWTLSSVVGKPGGLGRRRGSQANSIQCNPVDFDGCMSWIAIVTWL